MNLGIGLSLVCCVFELAALVRIAMLRAFKVYPFFAAYLCLVVLQTGIPLLFDNRSHEYLVVFAVSMTLVLSFRIMVALEAWRLALSAYPRIGSAAYAIGLAWFLFGLLLASVFGLDGFHVWHAPWPLASRMILSLGLRYLDMALGILCAGLWAQNQLFDHGVCPNSRRHLAILSAYFTVNGLGMLAVHLRPSWNPLIGSALIVSAAGLYGTWALSMRVRGQAPRYRDLDADTSVLEGLAHIRQRVLPF